MYGTHQCGSTHLHRTRAELISHTRSVELHLIAAWYKPRYNREVSEARLYHELQTAFPVCMPQFSVDRNTQDVYIVSIHTQIAKFMGPIWGTPGSCRPQMGPILAPWNLLSGYMSVSAGIIGILPMLTWTDITYLATVVFSWIMWKFAASP